MKSTTDFHQRELVWGKQSRYSSILTRLPFITLTLLAVSLPFELLAPLWTIGPLSISNVELVLFLTLAFTAVSFRQSRHKWGRPDRYWLWLVPVAAGLLLSALLAPQLQANAFKASLRLISGMLLALAALQILHRPVNGRVVGLALVTGGLVAAFIGWWEISQSQLAWMRLFRPHITRVGAILRLTGPFDYANQASMFMEATFPLLIAAAWSVRVSHIAPRFKMPLLASLFLMTLFYAQAIILTLSRAGAATMIVVCLLLAVLLGVQPAKAKRQMAMWWLAAAGVTAVLIAANVFLSDQFRLRLQGGNVDNWYRAQIIAPSTLEMTAGTTLEVPLTVTNGGTLVWQSQGENPILLGARLLNEEGTQAYSELRWPFPQRINPQETVPMVARFTAPTKPGVYELRWDVVHEHVTWFGIKSGLYATSQVTVLPGDGPTEQSQSEPFVMSEQAAWDYVGPVPDRSTLWRLAVQMIGERPLLGIGMDNFRLTYGQRLGNPTYDNTVHTNNFYLELIVSMGIIGAFPLIMWSVMLLMDLVRALHHSNPTMWQAALAAGLLAFFIHGFFDFFLLFNAVGLLFWLLTALWVNEKRNHAYWI